MKASELTAQITQRLEELARLTDSARFSAELRAYLRTLARFHRYSWHNQWLILSACPHATQVAGYRDWLKLHRSVKRGEKGIPILAPCRTKPKAPGRTRRVPSPRKPCATQGSGGTGEEDETESPLFFKVVYVWDVSQTAGEPLPPIPEWRSLARQAELQQKLIAFAERQEIVVTITELPGDTQGISGDGNILLSPQAGTKTTLHELAHELLRHHDSPRNPKAYECEAESVAYVVAQHFGLDGLNSPNYLALWGASAADIRASLEVVRACAAQIINGVEEGAAMTTD